MLNEVKLMGHLAADPEIRRTQDGKPVANFRMATTEKWRDKASGEPRERTEWHNVVIFNEGLAGVAEKYLKKGSQVLVSGKLQTRKWQDKEGADRYTTEVVLNGPDAKLVMTGGGPGGNRPPAADSPDEYGQTKTRAGGSQAPIEDKSSSFDKDLDDEIPFTLKIIKLPPRVESI